MGCTLVSWRLMRHPGRADKSCMEAALSAITQALYQSQVSYAVAAKAMDAMRQEGGAALALLEGAAKVQSQAVGRGDAGVAAAVEELAKLTDENGRLDVTA